jgi:hypothetical protein
MHMKRKLSMQCIDTKGVALLCCCAQAVVLRVYIHCSSVHIVADAPQVVVSLYVCVTSALWLLAHRRFTNLQAGPLASTTVGNACALLYTPVVSAYQQLACTSAQCYQHVVLASKQQQRRVHTGRASSLIMLLALLLPSMQCLANAATIITSSNFQVNVKYKTSKHACYCSEHNLRGYHIVLWPCWQSLSASPQYQWNVPPFFVLLRRRIQL